MNPLDPNKGGRISGLNEGGFIQEGERRLGEEESEEVAVANEIPIDLVRLSQLPGVSLMVDLTSADCRRRRRRHLSNLMLIQERVENSSKIVENSISSSDESIESDSAIEKEVRASMAMGEALGINFVPNSKEMMCNLIEMEAYEYSLNLEREANR